MEEAAAKADEKRFASKQVAATNLGDYIDIAVDDYVVYTSIPVESDGGALPDSYNGEYFL